MPADLGVAGRNQANQVDRRDKPVNRIGIQYFSTPWGELILGAFEGRLCLCDWRDRRNRDSVDARICKRLEARYEVNDSPLLRQARDQLRQYFDGERRSFDLPLLLAGSEFQQTVWRALMQIPCGETVSYLELAESIADRNSVRAVASANGANALSIFIPCHRVIGSDGRLVGYAGGLEAKAALLGLELAPGG